MKVYETSEIRNVALIGHGGSGKTTVASALLYATGAVNRMGRVDDGTAPTDYDDEEIARKISLQTALAALEYKGKKINLFDTPGYAAFLADAKTALAVADLAMLTVDAVAGVQVITERVFAYAEQFGLPVMFLVTKMDRENASFQRTLENIQERFGRQAVPIQIPLGREADHEGVVDLITMKAYRYVKDGTGKATVEDVPADLVQRAKDTHGAMVEMIAETDDTLMEHYFESGDLAVEEENAGLARAVARRALFPVMCCSAARVVGVQAIMDTVLTLAPAPAVRGSVVGTGPDGTTEIRRAIASTEPPSLFVFKTMADPFSGKLSMFRVMSGTIKGDTPVVNVSRDRHPERLGTVSVMIGKQMQPVPELRAGDIGVVAKLKETQTSDTLADPANPIAYPRVAFRDPAISYAVEPKSKGDEDKISNALARLMEEDPVLRVRRDPQTGELLVSGTGQIHVEVAVARMRRKFGVEAVLHAPKVPYLETIKKSAKDVEGKHKKQTGGRGQFGVCICDFDPLPRGSGIEFVDKIFGGSIPQNYRPAVEKGIRESADRGLRAGVPITDFRVTLKDGKYHDVDSSEMAFKIAGSLAFKEALETAQPVLLEPIMAVEITVPDECMGDIMGDLSSRRGKPQGMEAAGHYQIIKAAVPMSEMLEYASTLKSLTSDRGSYSMEFDHYDEAPAHVREKVVAAAANSRGE